MPVISDLLNHIKFRVSTYILKVIIAMYSATLLPRDGLSITLVPAFIARYTETKCLT